MEPNQSTSSNNASNLERSRRREARLGLNTLFKIFKLNPWLFLVGMWLFLIAIAAAAAFNITNTGFDNLKPKASPLADQKPDAYRLNSSVWLFSALAFTFAIGCVVLGKQLNHSLQFSRLRQERRQKLREETKALIEPLPVATEFDEPPLAPESESLAEMMDIRKHRSLDSILHDF